MKKILVVAIGLLVLVAMGCSNPTETPAYRELQQLNTLLVEGVALLQKQEVRFVGEHKMMNDSVSRLHETHAHKADLQKKIDERHQKMVAHHQALLKKYEQMKGEAKKLDDDVVAGTLKIDEMLPKLKALEKQYSTAKDEYEVVMAEHSDEFNKFLEEYEKLREAGMAAIKKKK
jgi:uncharacterized protein involved in exopolysaccharide biosynthesis